jgi:hypothetical protein
VIAFPHRDGGSVVAHGLGMSVNGQDPRSNVYLLDGTLQNDLTNGPAGSAAGTALGMDTIREFRVAANAYSAEYGRNSGGQVNVLTKSGTNRYTGTVFEYHRNDAMDARNYFDVAGKPDFHRNQFGGTLGGPIRQDRLFFFAGYEALIERMGRTISTVVPDDNARLGILPDPANPGGTIAVPINPAVAPFLAEFPRANGAVLGGGLAAFSFPFRQTARPALPAGAPRLQPGPRAPVLRALHVGRRKSVPADGLSAVPAQLLSRNQFFTGEYRHILSDRTLHTVRLGVSRTRIGQSVRPIPVGRSPSSWPGAGCPGRSTSAAFAGSGPRAPSTCSSCRTCSACRTTPSTRGAGTC